MLESHHSFTLWQTCIVSLTLIFLQGFCAEGSPKSKVSDKSKVLSIKAYELQEAGRHQEAAILYQRALKVNPLDWISCVNLASLLQDLSQREPAVRLLAQARNLQPQSYIVNFNLGVISSQIPGHEAEAAWAYRMAIAIAPNTDGLYGNLANHLMESEGRFSDAEVSNLFRKAIQFKPQYALHYFNWGSGLKRDFRHDEALVLFQKATTLDPASRSFLSDYVATLKSLGRTDEAEQTLQRAVKDGFWVRVQQYPGQFDADRRALPWHTYEEYRRASHPLALLVETLEANWEGILTEYESVKQVIPMHHQADLAHPGSRSKWRGCKVADSTTQINSTAFDRYCVLPVTRGVLDTASDLSGMVIYNAKFSVLEPGAKILDHVGPSNNRIKLHLALAGVEGAAIIVAGLQKGWTVGKCNIFDDSFVHSVEHLGPVDRVVLDMVVEHPDHKGTLSVELQNEKRRALSRALNFTMRNKTDYNNVVK